MKKAKVMPEIRTMKSFRGLPIRPNIREAEQQPELTQTMLLNTPAAESVVTETLVQKYGFHYITNEFTANPQVESDYDAFYRNATMPSATFTSLLLWTLWIMLSIVEIVNLFSSNPEARHSSVIDFLLTFPILIPIPFIVWGCRKHKEHMQLGMCIVAHLFAVSLIAGGIHSVMDEWGGFISQEMTELLDMIGVKASSQLYVLDEEIVPWWNHLPTSGNSRDLLAYYLKQVIFPVAQLNINLARPLIILVVAPSLKLRTFSYIIVCFSVNLGYCIAVATMYPKTNSMYFMVNKFLIVFALASISIVLTRRTRQSDRSMRLNFLHVRSVEEMAREVECERKRIELENSELKRMLQVQNEDETAVDLHTPIEKVMADLKLIQKSANLEQAMKEKLQQVLLVISRPGADLFTPDIQAGFHNRSQATVDQDTKGWATSVLSTRTYTRTGKMAQRLSMDFTGSRRELLPTVSLDEDRLAAVSRTMDKKGWDIDIFEIARECSNRPITYLTLCIFEKYSLFSLCFIDRRTLTNFLWFVDDGYLPNPYHNRNHAADVVCSVSHMIGTMDGGAIKTSLTSLELVSIIISAAIHDLKHPGLTNNYLIKSRSVLALRYSDSSVLERMHLSEAFFLMHKDSFAIFQNLKPKSCNEARKAMIELVLATDLSSHLPFVGLLKASVLSQTVEEVTEKPILLMKIVLKFADLGHTAKSPPLHATWTERIIEEFFLQGDSEKENNMEVSPFMNRENENSATNQVGFFEFIVLPFYRAVEELNITPGIRPLVNQMMSNYALWKHAERNGLTSIEDIVQQLFLCPTTDNDHEND